MILTDTALAKRAATGNHIRVGMIGAGYMGKAVTFQITNYSKGIFVAAIYSRNIASAKQAYSEAGITSFEAVDSQVALEERISKGKVSVVEDPMLVCRAENIDLIIEMTGSIEFGARVVMEAIRYKKHVVLMNAELDATLGPILKKYADRAGVIITNCDGDQPGVEMNLYRYVKGIGLKPVLCGNIKGLQDPYRNPETQKAYATQWGQKPKMVTSFADGTKMAFEQAIVANATGMTIAKRGMYGFAAHGLSLHEAVKKFPVEILTEGPGIVDYLVGVEPAPGIFVLATADHPKQKYFLNLYKLGEGPIYLFYTPFHLCHFDLSITCARAALFNDATIAPAGAPRVEVVATAKTNLKAGQIIDGIGGFMTYGQCETAETTMKCQLLPIGLGEGCVLKKDISRDDVLTYRDILLPPERYADQLRKEQNAYFHRIPSPAVTLEFSE